MKWEKRIEVLEEEIACLKEQQPAHSVPPAFLIKLDELESELALVYTKMEQEQENAQ